MIMLYEERLSSAVVYGQHKAKGECDSEATLINVINVEAMER